MTAFAYVAPNSLAETEEILKNAAANGSRAQILSGGTDLLVQMQSVDRAPRTIVDIKHIPDTNRLELGAKTTFIGAALSSAVLNENAELKARYPGLLEAADLIGSTQIQGRATIIGNLCNASPAGDTIPVLIANRAQAVIHGPGGSRKMAVEDFVVGVQQNALKAGEFVVGLELPTPAAHSADAYLRFIPRTEMDIAVAGCGVAVTLDGKGTCTAARVSIGAVAKTALLVPAAGEALIGTKLDDAALAAAGAACTDAALPINDKRGTVEFRKKVVAVLCRRAAAIARDRAQSR